MAGTPGCYQPTAGQFSPKGPCAPSGNVSSLQETPVTFQLLWKALSVLLLQGRFWIQPLGRTVRTGSSTPGHRLWAGVSLQPAPALRSPYQGEMGEEVGFLFRMRWCTLAVPRLKEAAGASPCALPRASCATGLPRHSHAGLCVCFVPSSAICCFFSALDNGWEEAFHSFSLSLPQHNDGNGCAKSNSVGFQRDAVG